MSVAVEGSIDLNPNAWAKDKVIKLVSITDDLTAAWTKVAQLHNEVEVVTEDIRKVEADAWVSPANSFGIMDGGIDAVYRDHFGFKIQEKVQGVIQAVTDGELLVGQAVVVATDSNPEWLIVAPTMRIPEILPPHTVNPYLAMKAVLNAWKGFPFINSIAVPGLGTLTGHVPAELCGIQVHEAIMEWKYGTLYCKTWDDVRIHQKTLFESI